MLVMGAPGGTTSVETNGVVFGSTVSGTSVLL